MNCKNLLVLKITANAILIEYRNSRGVFRNCPATALFKILTFMFTQKAISLERTIP